ncbi:unnamed protein product, partial [Chrysoparadoxa australica]
MATADSSRLAPAGPCGASGGICGVCESAGGYLSTHFDHKGEVCHEGYEIEVVDDNCIGYCVPVGTSSNTVADSGCHPPCGDFQTFFDFLDTCISDYVPVTPDYLLREPFEYTIQPWDEHCYMGPLEPSADPIPAPEPLLPSGCWYDEEQGSHLQAHCDPHDGPLGTVWVAIHDTPTCTDGPALWFRWGEECEYFHDDYMQNSHIPNGIPGCRAKGAPDEPRSIEDLLSKDIDFTIE